MKGKTCLVTGATSGIGLTTALGLAQRGATVVLAARNPERAAAAVTRIRDETGSSSVDALLADLSVQAEVRKPAQEFLPATNTWMFWLTTPVPFSTGARRAPTGSK